MAKKKKQNTYWVCTEALCAYEQISHIEANSEEEAVIVFCKTQELDNGDDVCCFPGDSDKWYEVNLNPSPGYKLKRMPYDITN